MECLQIRFLKKRKDCESRNLIVKDKQNHDDSDTTEKSKQFTKSRRGDLDSERKFCESRCFSCHKVRNEQQAAIQHSYFYIGKLQSQRKWIDRHVEFFF